MEDVNKPSPAQASFSQDDFGNHKVLPEHLDGLNRTHTRIDVVETTTKSPYKELNFIGTYVAITFATVGAFAGFVIPVTNITLINQQVGPDPSYVWIALAWVLCSSVFFTLVGRLSDIFGRRYFFAGCSGLATIGGILGCTASDINQLIAASVFLGTGAAGQISFNYVLGELVPVRHRFPTNGLVFLMTFPTSGLGPYIGRLFIVRSDTGWKGIYYLVVALNGFATLCWLLFYFPPKFQSLHRDRTKWQEIKELDFGGIVLYAGGLIGFLLGLSWGGQLYLWDSSHTLGTLISGCLILITFVLYEIYMPLRRPLIPMHLFWNYEYDICNILSIVGGMVYYSANVLFPQMVSALYTTDPLRAGLMSCAIGGGVCCGQFVGSFVAVPGGHLRYKMMFVTAGLTAFTAGLAGCLDNKAAGAACATLAGIMIGILEVIISTAVTIVIDDQSEMGTAAGVFGSLRGAGGVIATAIYVSIFTNRLTVLIKSNVAPALVRAGLPASSVELFVEAAGTGSKTALEKVPGVDASIIQTGIVTLKSAYAGAFRITWLATIAFGASAFIAACASRDIDNKLSHDVVRRLGPASWLGRKDDPNPIDSTALEKEERDVEHMENI